jgi:hypothetical protein
MEKMFGDWYRMVDLQPTGDVLKHRWEGIEAFGKEASPTDILDLARLFHQHKPKTAGFEDTFRDAFHNIDSAFPMTGNDIELGVLAGSCLLYLMKIDDELEACSAGFAMSCPNLQRKVPSAVVPSIETEAHARLAQLSAALRSSQCGELKQVGLPPADKTTEAIVAAMQGGKWPDVNKHLMTLLQATGTAVSQIHEAIEVIQRNLLLQREESDILWWMTAGFSRDFEKPMSSFERSAACILAGKELADSVSIFPGPHAAKAVLHRILMIDKEGGDKPVSIKEAVNGSDRQWRGMWVQKTVNGSVSDLCPVRFAVEKSLETEDMSSWTSAMKGITHVDASMTIQPLDLAYQVYTESLFVRAFEKLEAGHDD